MGFLFNKHILEWYFFKPGMVALDELIVTVSVPDY